MFDKVTLQAALEAERPVAFFMNGYGDTYMNLPALRALSHLFSGRLSLVCRKGAESFCFDSLELNKRVAAKDRHSGVGREFEANAVAAEVGACDLFLSLAPWHSSSLGELMKALDPKFSIGFNHHYSFCLERAPGKHSADLAFEVALALKPGCRLEDFAAPVLYPEPDRRLVRRLLGMLDPGTKTLAVHVDTLPEKMWVKERWASVLCEFLESHHEFVALMVGRVDQGVDAGRYRDRIIPCYGLSLASSCCLVAESDFFLGVDSCMLHVADFARVPGVGLFGPSKAEEFGFRLGPNITIQARDSMDGIKAGQVISALNEMVAAPHQSDLWQAEGLEK